jgi:hypothetical protein
MSTINIDKLINELLFEKNLDMLDRTKCSISARNIYNYLCGDNSVNPNDNLSNKSSNLRDLSDTIMNCNKPHVFYIHFDHLTNETSHYFIVIAMGNSNKSIYVFQSAVFEFNIYEWLYPEKCLLEEDIKLEEYSKNLLKDDRYDIYMDQYKNIDYNRKINILKNIERCKYSSARKISYDDFLNEFIPKLKSLEGTWTLSNYLDKCKCYSELFSCVLPEDIIRSHITLGIKDASVKFISNNMK